MSDAVSDDTLRAVIHRSLYNVKVGDAYVQGNLSEEDFVKIASGDDAAVDLFFQFVSKQLAEAKSPQKKNRTAKSVLERLRSQREKWIQEIKQYDKDDQETLPAAEDAAAAGANRELTKQETDTPTRKKPRAVMGGIDSVLVTCASVGVKQKAVDEDVDEPVKVTSQKPESDTNDDSSSHVDEDRKVSASGNKKTAPESVVNDGEKKAAAVKTEGMDVNDKLDTKETEPNEQGSKKRKAESKGDKKKPRKKPRGAKKEVSVKRKKTSKLSGAELEAARELVKKEDEREKAEILADIPDEHKKWWGQVGYAKWTKQWLPCLFVGPYNLGATSAVREDWMKMYHNTRNRRNAMSFLVYWYGTENLNDAFSFITRKGVVSYDEGIKKKFNKLPSNVQKKLDAGKKLTQAEENLIRAHNDLAADLSKQPQERLQFDWETEAYKNDEYVRTMVALKESDDDMLSSDDDEDLLSSDSSSVLESGSDDNEDAVLLPAKKKKKPVKQPVSQPIQDEDMSFAEDEISSDDVKDEDVKLSEESESDEEDDEDYLGKEKKLKKKSAKDSKVKGKEKRSVDRKRSKVPKEKKEPTPLALTRRENKTFSQNEEDFLPILKQWKSALKDEGTDSLQRLLNDLFGSADSMGAPFIEEYGISPLLKETKGLFKQKNVDTTMCKALNKKLGEVYTKKKALVPEHYKPKKRKSDQKLRKDRASDRPPAPKPKRQDTEATESSTLDQHPSTSSMPGSSSQSSAAHGTPVRHVLSQGSPTPREGQSRGVSPKLRPQQAAKTTSQKSEKTSFSLNRLFSKPSSSQPESGAESSTAEKQSGPKVSGKSLPSWMTSVPSTDDAKLPSERVDRLLAFEFFQGAAARFPKDKVNRDAMARALEAAAYQWSLEQYRKEDTYWPKVHAIVAGICGKRKPGTLVAAIMAGDYESARDVITLSDEMLLHSFEGS